MATTKNLCAQIPIDLHERVSEERERLGETTSEYIANLIQEYYNMIENQKGGIHMTEKGRTMAFQIPKNSSSASSVTWSAKRSAPAKTHPAELRAGPDLAGTGRGGRRERYRAGLPR